MRTFVRVETETSTAVGTAFLFAAGLAAAAGFLAMRQAPIGPELHISRSALSPEHSALVGSENVSILSLDFFAKQEPLLVTELAFSTHNTETQQQFTACELRSTDDLTVAESESFNVEGRLAFHNLSLVVPAERTIAYQLVCQLTHTKKTNDPNTKFLVALEAPTDVTVTLLDATNLPQGKIILTQPTQQYITVMQP